MSDAPTTDPTTSLRRVRWAQAIAFGVVAVALIATALQSFVGARRSAETLTLGQGRRLLDAVQREHHRYGRDIEQHLDGVLRQNEKFGLRCIGLPRRDHVQQAGRCLLSGPTMREMLHEAKPDRAVAVGDRVAMIDQPERPGLPGGGPPEGPPLDGFEPPARWSDGPPPSGGPAADRSVDGARASGRPPPRPAFGEGFRPRPPGRDGPPRGGPRLPPVVIEFEPIQAEALQASVTHSGIVALIAVVVLLVSGFALFRLSRRAEQLQHQAEQDRRLVTLGEMASVLAHEIRNPLAALKGNAQILAEQLPEDARERRGADRVVRSAIRLEALTEDLLSLVRSSEVNRTNVSPTALLNESLAQIDFDRFETDTSTAPATWSLDPSRMQQVLVNLLRNAAEASPDGRSASVAIAERGGRLVIAVRDAGDGIPAGEEERIFDPFVTNRVQGTGLGLAVARRIVELHGGTIRGRNLASGGAEFELVIP